MGAVFMHWPSGMQTLGFTWTKPIHWECANIMCINKRDVYKNTQSFVVEVFGYACRHTGFELSWTHAESHPRLTTGSFVCGALTTSRQEPAGESRVSTLGHQSSHFTSTVQLLFPCVRCKPQTFSL